MATMIHLAKSGELINNCLTVVGLPPTGPFLGSPNNKLSFPECVVSEEQTAYITGVWGSGLENRFDDNYFCCSPIDGGSA